MSTSAVYTFADQRGNKRHIFIHHDGYPTGAAEYLRKWYRSDLRWPESRFEADEAAAAFVAENKTSPGGVRVLQKRTGYADVAYGYTVTLVDDTYMLDADGHTVTLVDDTYMLEVHDTDYWDGFRQTLVWKGLLIDFINGGAAALECGRA